jgi:hypothetical protein
MELVNVMTAVMKNYAMLAIYAKDSSASLGTASPHRG